MNDIVYVLAGVIISFIVPLVAAVFIKVNFSTATKGIIASVVAVIFGLGLAIVQASINHSFDEGKDTLLTIIGVVIASHTFYEMFLKAIAQEIQVNVGVK